MSFDVFDKNKLIGMVQIDDYERVTYCKDCTYYYDGDGYCCYHKDNVQDYDYCSFGKRKNKKVMIYTDKESGCTIMSGDDKHHYLLVTESGQELNIYSMLKITDSNAQEIINYYLAD